MSGRGVVHAVIGGTFREPALRAGMAIETPDADSAGGRGLVLVQAVVVVVVVFLIAVLAAGLGRSLVLALGVDPDGLSYDVAMTVLQSVGFLLGVVGYLVVSRDASVVSEHVRPPTLRDAGYAVAGLLGLLVAVAVISQVLSALDVRTAQNQVVATGRRNPEYFLYMIPVSLLLVGPIEETIFRGVVQGTLRRSWGAAASIVISSAIFGAIHLPALLNNGSKVSYLIIAAALGLILGTIYELSDNLAVPAVVHGTYNAVLFGVQYAVVTGLVG